MPKLYSNKPVFVELFYSVVAGSAIALLSLANTEKLIFQVVWVVALLEDWFVYYRHVVDEDPKKVPYSFRSLMIEFGILVTWFLGFQALKEVNQEHRFLFFFSAFYFLKVLAGVFFYAKHKQLFSRRMMYDSLWLILLAVAWSLSKFGCGLAFAAQFWVVTGTTTVVLIVWWLLMHFFPPK